MKYFLLAVIAIMALACHKDQKNSAAKSEDVQNVEVRSPQAPATADTTAVAQFSPPPSLVLQGTQDWDKKIIKTANVNLELKNYNNFNNSIHQSLKAYGAYIAQEQQLQSEGQISNQVSIKVPVDRFEELMNFISTTDKDVKVLDKQIVSEDVSAEYVDSKSRAETKRQLRAKYFELMKQAKKMDDVLQVQQEINSITEDIEAATGRAEFLSHQSAYSTINLKYYQILDAAKVDDATPGFFTSFIQAFKRGGSIITNLILFFVNIWPLLLGGIALWYFIKRSRFIKPKQVG